MASIVTTPSKGQTLPLCSADGTKELTVFEKTQQRAASLKLGFILSEPGRFLSETRNNSVVVSCRGAESTGFDVSCYVSGGVKSKRPPTPGNDLSCASKLIEILDPNTDNSKYREILKGTNRSCSRFNEAPRHNQTHTHTCNAARDIAAMLKEYLSDIWKSSLPADKWVFYGTDVDVDHNYPVQAEEAENDASLTTSGLRESSPTAQPLDSSGWLIKPPDKCTANIIKRINDPDSIQKIVPYSISWRGGTEDDTIFPAELNATAKEECRAKTRASKNSLASYYSKRRRGSMGASNSGSTPNQSQDSGIASDTEDHCAEASPHDVRHFGIDSKQPNSKRPRSSSRKPKAAKPSHPPIKQASKLTLDTNMSATVTRDDRPRSLGCQSGTPPNVTFAGYQTSAATFAPAAWTSNTFRGNEPHTRSSSRISAGSREVPHEHFGLSRDIAPHHHYGQFLQVPDAAGQWHYSGLMYATNNRTADFDAEGSFGHLPLPHFAPVKCANMNTMNLYNPNLGLSGQQSSLYAIHDDPNSHYGFADISVGQTVPNFNFDSTSMDSRQVWPANPLDQQRYMDRTHASSGPPSLDLAGRPLWDPPALGEDGLLEQSTLHDLTDQPLPIQGLLPAEEYSVWDSSFNDEFIENQSGATQF